MKSTLAKRNTGILLAAALILFTAMAAAIPAPASAALPAPNWLPGQPLLAGNQVIAMWLPIPGAVKYIVYLNGEKILETPANQYMGLAPEESGEYKFQVRAVDASGVEGPLSVPGTIRIIQIQPPTDLIFRPDPENMAVSLRWKNPKEAAITNVFKSESKNGPFKLLASVTGEDFKDTNLEFDREYYYALSSKDVTGKESSKSETLVVKLEKPKEVAKAIKIDMVVVPSKEVQRLQFIDQFEIADITSMHPVSNGNLWITTGRKGFVVELSPSLEVLKKYDILATMAEAKVRWINTANISVLEGDRFTVVDNKTGTVATLDVNGRLLWSVKTGIPPVERKDIWTQIRPDFDKIGSLPNQPLYVDPDTLWITEGQAPFVHVLDPDTGKTVDYFAGYIDPESGETVGSGGVGTVALVDESTAWFGESLVHRAVAFDVDTKKIKYIVGSERDGYKGGFLGVNCFLVMPDGNVLVGDAGVGTLQVFDVKTGKYLYHIGGEKVEPDPELKNERPKIGLGGFSGLYMDPGGRLFVKDGFTKIITVRELMWDKKEVVKTE